MTEEHVALSTPRVRELVTVVLEEFDRWTKHAAIQAAGLWPDDSEKAAESALYDVRVNLDDHLCIQIGVTLAAWELGDAQ